MKIAYIAIKGLPFSGGIEQYTEQMATALVKRGHDVTIYMSKNYGNRTGTTGEGYHICALPAPRNMFLEKFVLVFFASIHQIFRNYDIVHYHALGPSIWAFIPKIQGKKVVIQSHGIEWQRSKWGRGAQQILKLLERLSYNMGDCLTVVSKTLKAYFRTTYNKESIYIPTAIELPENVKWKESNKELKPNQYYLSMGRLVPEKGIHYLISAFRCLDSEKKLVIAGRFNEEDTYCQELKTLAEKDSRVIFWGEVRGREKAELLSNAYAFVLPSELEGLSIALLEAMSYKRCCIVSDIPNNMEIAEGRSIAFHSKSIESLLGALNVAESDTQKVNELGKVAYEYVKENHQFEHIVNQMEDLYYKLNSNRRKNENYLD